MKNWLILCLFVLVFSSRLFPQKWEWQSWSPSGFDDINFFDNKNGCLFGSNGQILITSDGGENWTRTMSCYGDNFKYNSFISKDTGWAGGYNYLLYTTNGGKDWSSLAYFSTFSINSLHFIDGKTGWVAGTNGMLMKTENAGKSWTPRKFLDSDVITKIKFLNKNTGFINLSINYGSSRILLKTSNGGQKWDTLAYEFSGSAPFYHIVDEQNMFAVFGDSLVMSTNNAGISWNTFYKINNEKILTFSYKNASTAWLTTLKNGSYITYQTTNGGSSWSTIINTYLNPYITITAAPDNSLWAIGAGYFAKSSDGGKTWISKFDFNKDKLNINSSFFIDSQTGWAACYYPITGGKILRTSDGGKNWDTLFRTPGVELSSIYFTDKNTGWVCGNDLLKTTDGGKTWNTVQTSSSGPQKVYFKNSLAGWISGYGSMCYQTTDGGKTWNDYKTSIPFNFSDMQFPTESFGWMAGTNNNKAAFYTTTNGGKDWINRAPDSSFIVNSANFINETTGWITTTDWVFQKKYSSILKTIDGGISWQKQIKIQDASISSMKFVNENNGWAVGPAGIVLCTSDGGKNWIVPQIGIPRIDLNTVFFTDQKNGWITGNYNIILHTTDGGITFINEKRGESPSGFSLYQNYPNPFNPSTVISYSLPAESDVKINIYNLLGQKISELVNTKQKGGTYSITFNAAGLSSGIYFYTMAASTESNSFIQTKKFIFIK